MPTVAWMEQPVRCIWTPRIARQAWHASGAAVSAAGGASWGRALLDILVPLQPCLSFRCFLSCVCVLLCFIKAIVGNRYGPGVSSRASQKGHTLWRVATAYFILNIERLSVLRLVNQKKTFRRKQRVCFFSHLVDMWVSQPHRLS